MIHKDNVPYWPLPCENFRRGKFWTIRNPPPHLPRTDAALGENMKKETRKGEKKYKKGKITLKDIIQYRCRAERADSSPDSQHWP